MARSVLLVEPDLDALGALASRLRSLGLTVLLADSPATALERARSTRVDAILVSETTEDHRGLLERIGADRALAAVACFLLSRGPPEPAGLAPTLPIDDPDAIAKALHGLPSKPPPMPVLRDDFRGDLQQVSVVDLLQLLSMNRRTGSLSIVTSIGSGEVRLKDGEVIDAMYRRLEAEKALFRLLCETDGTFAFTSGTASGPARMATPTNALLMEGLRQLDESRRLRHELAVEEDALLAVTPPVPGEPEPTRRVLLALTAPRTLDELLDELALADHEILQALGALLRSGEVRRIPKGAVRVPLAEPERLGVLGAMASRMKAPGYSGPVRILLAAKPRRLSTVVHALQRIADASSAAELQPPVPIPFAMATLRVGDTTELMVVALPAVDTYGPLWTLALPGSAAVLRLEATETQVLDDVCGVAGVPVLDATALLGQVDEADPAQLAALLRLALEAVAGE